MRLASNVYAVLDLAHPIGVNTGFVVTDAGVVAIDSGWTHSSALMILGYIEAVAPRSRIKYLILTEHHSDHVFGAHLFKAKGAEIIAHKSTREFLEGDGKDYVEIMIKLHNKPWHRRMPEGYDFGRTFFQKVKLVLPDRTIDETTDLHVGGEELRLIRLLYEVQGEGADQEPEGYNDEERASGNPVAPSSARPSAAISRKR